ncbi:MAG: DNA-directed RNA polymerase subunit beta [Dehalococcoidia bacterium]|nr:DNA-directed RNA polymerase subunit beta [Dehalococcoidia bacterium]
MVTLANRIETTHGRRSYSRIADVLSLPNLNKLQLDSFLWFQKEGLREVFDEISPIEDFTRNRLALRFQDYRFGDPKYSERECRTRDLSFAAPLWVKVQLLIKETGEIPEQEIFLGDFPLMTSNATFIINGAERVVVSQLVRSPGVYFTVEEDAGSGRDLCSGKLIPNRGAWLEFETSNKDVVSVKVDRKRKLPITTLLRASGLGSDEEILNAFRELEESSNSHYISTTIEKEPSNIKTVNSAKLDFYKRLRPGDPPTMDNARTFLDSLFFNPRRYDLGRVGRYKLNKRLGLQVSLTHRVLTLDDLTAIVRQIILINTGNGHADDIDHLGNRRVRSVGELIQNQFRIGLLRMERIVKERMSIQDPHTATPGTLVNIRPLVAAIREFFGSSQLSQFMDQTNPLAELTHKRRLSALGPGGLSRERAGFDVRDVHHSHYGRICPIETPEGPNIGLIGSLATYGVVNQYGFIETPYRRVHRDVKNSTNQLLGRTLREDVLDKDGNVGAKAGELVDPELASRITSLPVDPIKVTPFVTDDIVYLSADEEDRFIVAQANSLLNEKNEFIEERVEARHGQRFLMERPDRVEYMDVSPKQIVSVAAALIPFLEHDDANRALMGANMQRQAVPLIRPDAPLVGTGMEQKVAEDCGQLVISSCDGIITSSTSKAVVVRDSQDQECVYPLLKYVRTNQGTCVNQHPIVQKGDIVRQGQVLADSTSTDRGELALGQNVLCAFMIWEGSNFEDAIVLSEAIVREDKFTSIHIEKYEVEARDTKLGPEEITRDIPNVGEESLRDLDERGIIRVGAEVGPGDILVGKITPKGETELTAEEKLLRAIFGEKAREVKDTSLRVPHGGRGTVVNVEAFTRANRDELHPGVNELVRVSIAQKRKITAGDKMAGRHGNKGVVARILPVEDMPYLPDGTPVEIILNPIGVPSRMNVGQILETHLGLAAQALGFRAISPVFDGVAEGRIEDSLAKVWLISRALGERGLPKGDPTANGDQDREDRLYAWLAERGFAGNRIFKESSDGEARLTCLRIWLQEDMNIPHGDLSDQEVLERALAIAKEQRIPLPTFGKITLYDGRTGEAFEQPVTVGSIYMMKLIHLVEDKVHARSTGPYSLITQQPLGGKAQFGGQRFGEMEVWALEAYGAAHTLQEMLTVKSDDVVGRVKTYEAIVKGDAILEPGVPESFKVLVKELQSLSLAIEVLNEEEEKITFAEELGLELPDLGIRLDRPEEG